MRCRKCGNEDGLTGVLSILQPRGMLNLYQIMCPVCNCHWEEKKWIVRDKDREEQNLYWGNVIIVNMSQLGKEDREKICNDIRDKYEDAMLSEMGEKNDR